MGIASNGMKRTLQTVMVPRMINPNENLPASARAPKNVGVIPAPNAFAKGMIREKAILLVFGAVNRDIAELPIGKKEETIIGWKN